MVKTNSEQSTWIRINWSINTSDWVGSAKKRVALSAPL
ncbi:hypothetical protein Bhyg_09994 [Pseudolycoriella hygida]|uniref:Uncharacterized protein n=1 Tax=Pseudolycoriella hygida TaxID=35572 RepID=A0A9Q0MU96_9DIPT|nr:hypothetical protein Bhyg_09994 [Pseudolycoriella hygida]